MIKAEILKDSINPQNHRITTWKLTLPRIILAELNTHRVFSRNTASSRAIPISRFIKNIQEDPFMPYHYGAAQKGMQAEKEISLDAQHIAGKLILKHRDEAIKLAQDLSELGLHKQVANRYLEPWMYVESLVTATDFENWFALREHPDAEPHIQILARKMLKQYNANEPDSLEFGEWHIPFDKFMPEGATIEQKLKIASARAARVSYMNFEGVMDYEKDYALHDDLASSGHWSALEHCAQAKMIMPEFPADTGNFTGWSPYRKQFKNERRKDDRVIKKFHKSNRQA